MLPKQEINNMINVKSERAAIIEMLDNVVCE